MYYWKQLAWDIGLHWGDHNPNPRNLDWYGKEAVRLENDELHLTVLHKPQTFSDGSTKPYCVGYLSSIDTVHRGHLKVEYTLPVGRHLWPAIWLFSPVSWPPEIDIMEGWPNTRGNYRKLFKNKIFPTVHFVAADGRHRWQTFHDGIFNGTRAARQPLDGRCTCELLWHGDSMEFRYNGHRVGLLTDRDILKRLDQPMNVILNLAVGYDFTAADYTDYRHFGREFIIHDLTYEQ